MDVIELQEELIIEQEDKRIILEKGDKIRVLESAIPQERLKRAFVRDEPLRVTDVRGISSHGYTMEDVLGWFVNSSNTAFGWYVLKASDEEKREFGTDVFRTYSEKTDSLNIVRFNILGGTYAFVDNEYYAETDQVKFEKMTPYSRLIIEPKPLAFEEFNIV